MRYLPRLALLFSAILFGVVGASFSRGETEPNNKQTEQSILGSWHADSVALLSEKGERQKLPIDKLMRFSITISDKTLTMFVDNRKCAELSYLSDPKQIPSAFDAKMEDQELPGIFELKDKQLKISLNDDKKGRPKDFGGNDIDLVLRRFEGQPLMMINADGSKLRTLLTMTDYTSCGSPEWSHDGGKITFDCWRSVFREDYSKSHVFVVNADGREPKDLGDGTLPSWSPDGKQIAFSRYSPNYGIWIMNADGSDNHMIEPEGWSADWAPKKNLLAYTVSNNLYVRDLKSQERRKLLEKEYRQIYWGLSWSPDAEWICFKGVLPDGGSEVAIVHVEGQSKGFKVLLPDKAITGVKDFTGYFSWSPDGKQILAPILMEGEANMQLYSLDPEGKTPPRKLAGQDPSVKNYGSSWSPDGKNIVLAFWPGTTAEKREQSKSLLQTFFSGE
jgi:TolB protein